MIFTYDNYNKLEQSRLFLANPQKKEIGELSGVKNLHLKVNFSAMSEATFTIYKYENNEENEFYDKVENKRLIEIRYVGWFQIIKCEDHDDGANPFKNVSCISLENQLTSKKVTDLNGTYALFDSVNPDKSILHKVASATGWTISHVDNELLGKYRTFSTNSEKIYGFLMSTVASSFQCIFQFNTYDKSISCYKIENLGSVTDIVLSRNNILQDFSKESSADKIITKLRVLGSDGVSIEDVNLAGTDYIINLDYYKNTNWMSEGLVQALNTYQSKYNSYISNYQATLASYKTKQTELTALNTELTALKERLTAAQDKQGDIVSDLNGVPVPSDTQYAEYQTALANIATYTNLINSKNTAIINKQNEVNIVKASLDVITNVLNMNNNFTADQISELGNFLTEDAEYQDSSFAITDDMTQEDIIAMEQELLSNGYYELSLACKPAYSYKTSASNLFTINEDKDAFISYDNMREQLEVGNFITIKIRDDYYITVRLLTLDFDFSKLEDIELTFSDLPRNSDKQSQYAEILANASKTSSSYSFSRFGYDKAASITNDVQEFMTSTFKATTNALVNSDNVTTEFGKFGIRNKEWLPDQNKYSDFQSWWTNNTLLFTDSNWADSKAGIGVFTDETGAKTMSVMADVICGRLIMSQKLNISNASGTYSITDTNGFQAVNGIYSVTINPNIPSEIFKIAVNGSNKLYLDAINNKLVFSGDLQAASGTFKGSLQAASGTFTGDLVAAGGTFSGDLQAVGGTFSGNLSAAGGTFTGTLVGVDGTFSGTLSGNQIRGGTIQGSKIISSFNNDGDTVTLEMSDSAFSVSVLASGVLASSIFQHGSVSFSTSSSYAYASYGKTGMLIRNSSGSDVFKVDSYGDIFCRDITCDDIICDDINGGTPITSDNRNDFLYDSNRIDPITTSGGNVGLHGLNVASVNWCNDTFQRLSSSDMRLKKDILSVDDSIDRFYFNLKPKKYRFKEEDSKVHIGLLAQEVSSNLINSGLGEDYAILDKRPIRTYTDEGQYVDDEVMRVEYEELTTMTVYEVQKLKAENEQLHSKLSELEQRLIKLEVA